MNKRFPLGLIGLALFFLATVFVLGFAETGATASLSGSIGEPVWGSDIRVNPTIAVDTSTHRNSSLAINPANPNIVLAGYDNQQGKEGLSGYAWSTDAGRTWLGGHFQGPWGPSNMTPGGNVSVGFDANGVGYYTSIALASQSFSYYVLTTTNGTAWSTPVPIITAQYDESRYQSHLAVDRRTSGAYAGSLYISWLYTNNVPPYLQGITMRYSRDGGHSWSNDVQISDPEHGHSSLSTSVIASNGVIYTAFPYIQDSFIGNAPHLYLDRSTDGGLTWGTDRLISGAPIVQIGGPDWKQRELVLVASQFCAQMRMHHYPSIAVSPTDPNTVYATWNDGRWERDITDCDLGGKHSDIAFSRSTDAGVTWSPTIRLNDDALGNGIDQFMPTIGAHPSGLIGVTWHDRRYSDGYRYDLVYSQSTDGGLTWSKNQRVSDVSSDPEAVPDYKGIDYIGYRVPLVFGYDYILPGWLDTRRGTRNGDFFTDRGVLPVPTVTPLPTQTPGGPSATPEPTNTSIPTSTPTATSPIPSTPTVGATATPCTIQFSDVPESNTFYKQIRCLACLGIISGYADNTFRPNNEVTRGQLSKIVANSAGFNEPMGTWTFQDVPTDSTFYLYVERMATRGIIGGYPCGGEAEPCEENNLPYFRPNANATRGQISKIVSNAADYSDTPGGQTFEDVPSSNAFYAWIERLASRGIMGGYTCGGEGEPCGAGNLPYFRPNANATRGQVSKIVGNTFLPGCSVR
ncbi:MAG TPA: S-layer homology domain-containing protein [Chloroflexia bacterium]|jgi:hypothetical protein